MLVGEIGKVIVGQKYLIDRLLIGLLADGHVLLEGVPGLAKTLSVKTLSAAIQTTFHRIQFTPDLLPADVIGTLIYNPKDGEFRIKKEFQSDGPAQNRIQTCLETVARYGKPAPRIVLV